MIIKVWRLKENEMRNFLIPGKNVDFIQFLYTVIATLYQIPSTRERDHLLSKCLKNDVKF